jgi:hypothetical protein
LGFGACQHSVEQSRLFDPDSAHHHDFRVGGGTSGASRRIVKAARSGPPLADATSIAKAPGTSTFAVRRTSSSTARPESVKPSQSSTATRVIERHFGGRCTTVSMARLVRLLAILPLRFRAQGQHHLCPWSSTFHRWHARSSCESSR